MRYALPGPYLRDMGYIALMADFPCRDSVAFKDELIRNFPYPVFIEFDAHVSVMAEWSLEQDNSNNPALVSVLMEQGLGAGVVQNGEVFYGPQGMPDPSSRT